MTDAAMMSGSAVAESGSERPLRAHDPLDGAWRWALLALLLGAVLRLLDLPVQLVAEDELHELRAAATRPVAEILTTFGGSYFSRPLAALARGVAHLGWPLDERSLRLPAIAAGLLWLVFAPRVASRLVGRTTGVVFGLLVAVSPLLVLYSRLARPYLPALLFSFAALVCLHDGWFEPSPRAARAGRWRLPVAAVCAALSVWILPLTAPALGALWVVAGGSALLDRPRGSRQRWPALAASIGLGLAVAAGTMLPALRTVETGLLDKLARGARPGTTDFVRVLSGLSTPAVAWAFVALSLLGWMLVTRRRPALALLAAAATVAQVVALDSARPLGFGSPLIAVRYLLTLVPLLLLGVAAVVATSFDAVRSRGGRVVAATVGLALLAALGNAGPLPDWVGRSTPVLAYSGVQELGGWSTARTRLEPLPTAYRFVEALEPDRIAVGPAIAEYWFDRIFVDRVRRFPTTLLLAVSRPSWPDQPLVRLRHAVAAHPEPLLDSDADVFVLHRRPELELAELQAPLDERARAMLDWQAGQAQRLERHCRRAWGRPAFEDERHAVWDLRRVRWRRETAGPSAKERAR